MPSSESLYSRICGAIGPDGTLSPDFTLRRTVPDKDGEVQFADGAYDGISLYHMSPDRRDIHSLEEILGLICAGEDRRSEECLRLYFSSDPYLSMLPLADDFQNWVIAHKDTIDAARLAAFCVSRLKTSADVETVKFLFTCLALLNTGESVLVRNLTKIFALSDEFTLFALFLMQQWPDADEAIFDAARHVSGWGRIHAVAHLRPATEEIRRWLLLEGWRNTISPSYSALICAEKAGLTEAPEWDRLDEEAFTAACALTEVLLSDGPAAGLAGLSDRAGYLDAFLSAAGRFSLTPDQEAIRSKAAAKRAELKSNP